MILPNSTTAIFGQRPFCLIDIETTGLSPNRDEITEIAALRVNEAFEITGEISRLVRIRGSVPWQITRITGISDLMLHAHGQPLADVLEETHQFVAGAPSFAHNARFDRSFLNTWSEQCGIACRFPLECSIPVFKKLLPQRKGYGLPALAEGLRISGAGAHRALADCRILLECLKRAHGRHFA